MNDGIAKPSALIVVMFVLTRLWPLCTAEPWSYWEVFEARKLNQYGFVERQGALLDVHYLTGVVPKPERFNYPNHPAPIHWLNMLLEREFGDWGVVTFGTLAGLASCLLCLFALRKMYEPGVAFAGAALFTLAPSNIIYDIDPNQGAMGAMLWPIAAFGLASDISTRAKAWLIGMACLLAGQASWMSWTIFGVLLIAASGLRWNGRVNSSPIHPIVRAILLGGGLTVLLFAVQIAVYTPDWQKLAAYMDKQSLEKTSFLTWIVRSFSRSALSLGPALALGAFLGAIVQVGRRRTIRPLEWAAFVYFPIFAAASFVLRGFFNTENWPYEYLVFPAVMLTCSFLACFAAKGSRRAAAAGLLVLCIPGLAYVFLRFSNPILSAETQFIAELIAKEARPDEVVATNLKDQESPLPSWNVSGLHVARQKADRLLRSSICTEQQLLDLADNFDADQLDVMFLGSAVQPMDDELKALLQARAPAEYVLPRGTNDMPLSLRMRGLYWKLSGRHQVENTAATEMKDDRLTVAHFRLSRSAGKTITIHSLPDRTGAPDTR